MLKSYKRELDHNYLVLVQEEFQDSYQVGMLVKNRLPGFLECRISQVDRSAFFYYEITSRQSLQLVLERKRLLAGELRAFLEGLEKARRTGAEYLLDTERILLDPSCIYLDPDDWTVFFCFCPFAEQEASEELLKLAEYLLDRLDRQDAEAVTLGYEFYRIAGEENPSLEKLLAGTGEGVSSLSGDTSERTDGSPGVIQERTAGSFGSMQMAVGLPEGTQERAVEVPVGLQRKEPNSVRENRGEWCLEATEDRFKPQAGRRTIMTSVGETSCLNRESEGLLLRSENTAYPDLQITKESFLIGKKKDAVDGWLRARGISRIHGRISREADSYYLTDLNSTNGTYLNGGRLGVNEKARIRPGDQIGFAEVKYIVEI